MVRPRRPRRVGPLDRRAQGTAAVVGVSVLTVVLLTVVASSGAVRVWSEAPAPAIGSIEVPATASTDPDGVGDAGAGRVSAELATPDAWWAKVIAVVGIVVLLRIVWIVVSVYWQLLRDRWERRQRRRGGLEALPGTNGDDDLTVEFDLAARLAELERGDPRNAIVACWSRLEDDVAAAGLPRRPSETSVEYTRRVLASASVDVAATLELAELYREARFSDHPVDEARRQRATDALRRVHGSLRVRAAGGVT